MASVRVTKMTRPLLAALVLGLSLVLAAAQQPPAPRNDRVVGELTWLSVASPAADFDRDIAAGSLHFIELTGQGPVVPGIGAIRRFMCYSEQAGTKVVDVGTDMVNGLSEIDLRTRAYKYAEAYNSHLLSYLDEAGLNDCAKGVDWDAAWAAVNKWAGNIGPGSRGTTKLKRQGIRIYLNDFGKHEAAAAEVCALLQQHGLDRAFDVEISPRRFINTDREDEVVYKLACKLRHEP